MPDATLTADDISFLSEFLNPVYLQPRTMKALSARFVQESSLELHDFLSVPIASTLSPGLRSLDAQHGLGPNRPYPIPPHTAGTGQGSGWTLKGPPHKWRYCVLESPRTEGPVEAALPLAVQTPEKIVRSLQDQLFGSEAFRRWLAVVSRLSPMRYAVEARRFCPGLGYTLATSEENEARLDVVLGLTPQVEEQESEAEKKKKNQNGKRRIEEEEPTRGWQTGEWGGWEVRNSRCFVLVGRSDADCIVVFCSVIWLLMTRRTTRLFTGRARAAKRPKLNIHRKKRTAVAPIMAKRMECMIQTKTPKVRAMTKFRPMRRKRKRTGLYLPCSLDLTVCCSY